MKQSRETSVPPLRPFYSGSNFGSGDSDLHELPDGSVVVPEHYASRYARQSGESNEWTAVDPRTETERDRGRLGYSRYLRRLAGVTQVVSPDLSSPMLHNRSSHSHKVALLSREIAENVIRKAMDPAGKDVAAVIRSVGGLDITACETAGLAHDLGHPPFGHIGEEILDKLLQGSTQADLPLANRHRWRNRRDRRALADGFEGNAQSFRIVSVLDRDKLERLHGLDLTNVTLAAILKYPYTRQPGNRKFSAYASEKNNLYRVRAAMATGLESEQQSLEASIMDLADDIAYAIHDLQDFLTSGVMNPMEVRRSLEDAFASVTKNNPDFAESAAPENPFVVKAVDLKTTYGDYFNSDHYLSSLELALDLLEDLSPGDDSLGRLQFNASLNARIGRVFDAIRVSRNTPWPKGPMIFLDSPQWHELQALKVITRSFLVNTAGVGMVQRSQGQVMESLFTGFVAWLRDKPKLETLPAGLREALQYNEVQVPEAKVLSPQHYRAIADYICSFSDAEATIHAQWLMGAQTPKLTVNAAL